MNETEVKFYKKLNEYYQERDYLFTLKSSRGHSYSIVDFLLFIVISSILLLSGIILSIVCQDIIYFLILIILSIPGFLVSLIIVKDRKKQINKINILEKELREMIEENKPLFNDKKLTIDDYIKEFKSLGFNIEIINSNNKKTYLLKGTNKNIKIITKNIFFINKLECYINDVNFKNMKNDDKKLNQLIKEYRLDSFNINYYQMLFSFYKYVIETLEDYFN